MAVFLKVEDSYAGFYSKVQEEPFLPHLLAFRWA